MQLAQKLEETYTYTYEDYLLWEGDTRYELYDGEAVALASPTRIHQKISTKLLNQFENYLEDKRCEVYHAPFDVRLFEKKNDPPRRIKDVVQPDLIVVCDLEKLDNRGCKGAPDLVVEILSPTTKRQDITVKYQLYQRAGVPEYWVVDPQKRTVAVHILVNGAYSSPELYTANEEVPVGVLKDCTINLARVFR